MVVKLKKVIYYTLQYDVRFGLWQRQKDSKHAFNAIGSVASYRTATAGL